MNVIRVGGFVACMWAVGIAAAGCAAGPAVTGRPSPFPRAPAPGWATPTWPGGTGALAAVLDTALALQGRPYRYGGESPDTGFDCSGLVWYVFLAHGAALPRTTAEQYLEGRPVDPDDIHPGDLVFFSIDAPGPSHVGIALDGRTIVHAPSTGSVVRVERFDTAYWQSRLAGVRRYEPGEATSLPGATSAGG